MIYQNHNFSELIVDSISFATEVRGVFVVFVVVLVQVGVEDQKKCVSIFDFYR